MERRTLAVLTIALWLGGLGWLGMRELTKPRTEKLKESAALIPPLTYYYTVEQNGQQIGSAFSAIDTVGPRITSEDFFRGMFPIGTDTHHITARTSASLTRGFSLQSFRVQLVGDLTPLSLNGKLPDKSPVLLPSLLPIAFMLTGEPKINRTDDFWVYNPVARIVQRVQLTIRAESLFTLADSAMYDSVAARWVPAHTDTVRAWQIGSDNNNLTAWVDAQGRIVTAIEPSGLKLVRTAYEIAFQNKDTTKVQTGRNPKMRRRGT